MGKRFHSVPQKKGLRNLANKIKRIRSQTTRKTKVTIIRL